MENIFNVILGMFFFIVNLAWPELNYSLTVTIDEHFILDCYLQGGNLRHCNYIVSIDLTISIFDNQEILLSYNLHYWGNIIVAPKIVFNTNIKFSYENYVKRNNLIEHMYQSISSMNAFIQKRSIVVLQHQYN